MNISVCKIALRLPENQSLKGKRRVIGSLCGRARNKFNVAIAEVGDNDLWQTAVLGISCVGNDARHTDEVVSAAIDFIESTREDVEIVEVERETLSGF
jgi:uncharacterized protein YlxP (DUF503 family)